MLAFDQLCVKTQLLMSADADATLIPAPPKPALLLVKVRRWMVGEEEASTKIPPNVAASIRCR